MAEIQQIQRLTSIPCLEDIFKGERTGDNPDYVEMLEVSLYTLSRFYDKEIELGKKLEISSYSYLKDCLQGIEGFCVTEYTDKEEFRIAALKNKNNRNNIIFRRNGVGYIFKFTQGDESSLTIESKRKIEDGFCTAQRMIQDQARINEDNLILISRKVEDYNQRILDLTKVTSLTGLDLNSSEVHFFIPRRDGVYHGSLISYEEGIEYDIKPVLNPALKSEWFSDENFLRSFQSQNGEKRNSAYLITNPSELPKNQHLLQRGFQRLHEDLNLPENLREIESIKARQKMTPQDILNNIIGKREEFE